MQQSVKEAQHTCTDSNTKLSVGGDAGTRTTTEYGQSQIGQRPMQEGGGQEVRA